MDNPEAVTERTEIQEVVNGPEPQDIENQDLDGESESESERGVDTKAPVGQQEKWLVMARRRRNFMFSAFLISLGVMIWGRIEVQSLGGALAFGLGCFSVLVSLLLTGCTQSNVDAIKGGHTPLLF
jgi:hypothetical protein